MSTKANVTTEQVQQRLNEVIKATSNPRPLMVSIAATLQDLILEEFDTQGHGKWPALKHRDGQPLKLSDRLYSSITRYADNETAAAGTNVIYAALQNYGAPQGAFGHTKRGAPIPWGDVPARRFIPVNDNGQLTPNAIERILETIDRFWQRMR